jgi:hypothetical protein
MPSCSLTCLDCKMKSWEDDIFVGAKAALYLICHQLARKLRVAIRRLTRYRINYIQIPQYRPSLPPSTAFALVSRAGRTALAIPQVKAIGSRPRRTANDWSASARSNGIAQDYLSANKSRGQVASPLILSHLFLRHGAPQQRAFSSSPIARCFRDSSSVHL